MWYRKCAFNGHMRTSVSVIELQSMLFLKGSSFRPFSHVTDRTLYPGEDASLEVVFSFRSVFRLFLSIVSFCMKPYKINQDT